MSEPIDGRLERIEKRLARLEQRLALPSLEVEQTPPHVQPQARANVQLQAPGAEPQTHAQLQSSQLQPEARRAQLATALENIRAASVAHVEVQVPVAAPIAPVPPPIVKASELPRTPPAPSPGIPGEGRGEGAIANRKSEITNQMHPVPASSGMEPKSVLPYVSPRPTSSQPQATLEQAIGLKWAGWIGAVVLLIGAALGVKYAYDQHWFAQLPVWIWPSIIAAFGFALLGAGEWVYRKVNVIPAASLFGAGIATLFLVSYIGHSYYALYSPTAAFVLMGLTTLIGSAVAMRGKLVSIAVLSLIGGNVAPLVMGDLNQTHTDFLAYLLMLQVIALTLAWWGRSKRWWMLRGLSLATTAFWMAGIIDAGRDGVTPLIFGIVYALLYHAEVIASAMRADKDPEKSRTLRHGGSVFVTLVIAGLTTVILTVLKDSSSWTRAAWLIAEATACLLATLMLRGGGGAVKNQGDPFMSGRLVRSLVPAYSACACALAILAVPVAFDGMSVEIGWALMAIALAIVGRSTKSAMARAGAVVAWICALSHLILTSPAADIFAQHPHVKIWLTIGGVRIASTTILAWGLALVGHLIGALIQESSEESQVAGTIMGIVASIVFVATSIIALPPLGATLSMILFAWVLMLTDIPLPRTGNPPAGRAMQSILILLAATVKWIAIDTLGQRLSAAWSPTQYTPVLNPLMGVGVLLAASLVGIYWLRRDSIKRAMPEQRHAPLAAGLAFAVAALLAIGFSFEIDRIVERAVTVGHHLTWPAWQLKQLAWTMLWSLCSVVLAFVISRIVALGDRRSAWMNAIATFAMLLIAKFVLLDTLFYRVSDGSGTALVLFNLQTMAAAVVVGSVMCIRMLVDSAKPQAAEQGASAGSKLHLLALFVVAWTGTFEIERFLRLHPLLVAPWPAYQFTQMAWTMWWTLCAVGGFVIGRKFDREANAQSAWAKILPAAIMVLAVKFAVADALFWRISEHVTLAPVVANMQMLTAAVSMAAMILLIALGLPGDAESSRSLRIRAGFLTWMLALLAISLEIDRFFEGGVATAWFTDARLAKQVAFSIVWSIFAVTSVAAGFRVRLASLRYFGLALLAFTLLKVVVVDLSQVSTGYRILSFLGLGLLMLGTSVLYGKLSPKLLQEPVAEPVA